MLVKKITFEDFRGNTKTEEFCFHVKEDELAKKELTAKGGGGFEAAMNRVRVANDNEAVYAEFEILVLGSLGYVSEDGFSFVKDEAYTKRFKESNAYAVLVVELLSDEDGRSAADKLVEFTDAVMPAKFREAAAKRRAAERSAPQDYKPSAREIAQQASVVTTEVPAPEEVAVPFPSEAHRVPTRAELEAQLAALPPEPTQRPDYGSAGAQQGGIEQVGTTHNAFEGPQAPVQQSLRRDFQQ